jgi:hypothetical protein
VKIGEETSVVKESHLVVDVTNGAVLSPIEPTGGDRPRSKSSPHLDIGNASLPKEYLSTSTSASALNTLPNTGSGSSARKGRFTVTMGGQNSAPPSPMKPQTPHQEQGMNTPNPLPNSATSPAIQLPSDPLPTAVLVTVSNQLEPGHKQLEEETSGRQTPVGIALENKGSTSVPLTQSSSVKKPKSRFTVKTISLEVSETFTTPPLSFLTRSSPVVSLGRKRVCGGAQSTLFRLTIGCWYSLLNTLSSDSDHSQLLYRHCPTLPLPTILDQRVPQTSFMLISQLILAHNLFSPRPLVS